MNQILVTEKIYITPELKRKKKMYKIKFCMSIFAICMLFSYYIYAEYDKEKSEAVSKEILTHLSAYETKIEEDNTIRNLENDVLIVCLDVEPQEGTQVLEQIENEEETTDATSTYTTEEGIDYTVEAILDIPRIEINYPVLSETSDQLLKISINKYWGPKPNQVGNYCIVGHNYQGAGTMFGKLYKIAVGDIVTLEDKTSENGKKVTYEVYKRYVVEPEDVSCTSQLTNGETELTLITCTNYNTQRLIVKCRKI